MDPFTELLLSRSVTYSTIFIFRQIDKANFAIHGPSPFQIYELKMLTTKYTFNFYVELYFYISLIADNSITLGFIRIGTMGINTELIKLD